jgi:hypothetical protein
VKKTASAFAMAFILLSAAGWAQPSGNPAMNAAMADIDASAPGVKPDKAISVKLQKALDTLGAQIDGGKLKPDDLAMAHLYHAKALYFLAVNNHHFTIADYDREDARAYRYEFEQAINLMSDQAAKTGKDWKAELAEANYQAGMMAVTIEVDVNTAYDTFFPACAALGRAECRTAMAKKPK